MSSQHPALNPADSRQTAPGNGETLAFPDGGSTTGAPAGSATDSGSELGLPLDMPAEPRTLAGTTVGDLEILEELGRGGMGVVYKARQISLDRLVAVKLLLSEQFSDPVRLARFQAEARASASLTHPNIVQVYQVGACEFGHYFVMEFIDGPSLERLVRRGKVPLAQAVQLLIPLAEAVHYAHKKAIVHRDLKPANIMVDSSGRPVIMDFGIAKFVGKASGLTQQGAIMGTPAYMAPEQAGEALDKVGPCSDVYSLGAILYALAVGRPPFEEDTALRTILKVIGPEMPPPLRQLRPQVPRELERICMKCLAKDPAERYASAQDLANDLKRLLQSAQKKAADPERSSLPQVFLVGPAGTKPIRVPRPRTIVGRASECDIILRASDVSKQHCQFTLQPDKVLLKDLGSANGTFVNDEKIERTTIEDGDSIRIAGHEFKVRIKS